jgi:hypothetical protein
MIDNKTSPDNVSRQVLKPSIGVLFALLGIIVWTLLEGSAVVVEPAVILVPFAMQASFTVLAYQYHRDLTRGEQPSAKALRFVALANPILLSVPVVILAIALLLGALGAQMVSHWLGTIGLVVVALLLPLLFFRCHIAALKMTA